jgi:formylglycine-generating enzyme required for sulfatase activity
MIFRFLPSLPGRLLRVFALAGMCIALAHAQQEQSKQPGLFESLGKLFNPTETPAEVPAAPAPNQTLTRNLSASAGAKRIALVIGNDAYKHVPPLEKAANDARAMGRALQQAGFETRTVLDANRSQMNKAINQFADDVAGGGIGVFFFAGHGVQVNNQNFLIPIDLQDIQREADVADQGVSLQGMQDKLAEVRAKFSLLVIDACRDNPLPKKAGRALGGTRGLSQASSAEGQMVVFSAGANQQALDKLSDNDRNPNGVFTREFLPWLAKPGVSIRDAVQGVRSAVRARAKGVNHEQFPAIYDQAEGNFYFVEGAAQGSPAPATQVASPTPQFSGARTREQIEDELWDAIKDGEKASVFEEYLKQYPKGRYLAQAKVKIAKLKAEARKPAPSAVSPEPTSVAVAGSDPDSALWNEVQKGNTADDYDVYLKQYPKGKYAALAKQRGQKLKDEAKQQAEAAEQSAWHAAERTQTPEGYAAYLASYPSGRYAALAMTRANKLKANAVVREGAEMRPGKVFKDCGDCPEMVVIPGGSFEMGSPASETGRFDREGPQHRVSIRSFAAGRLEVTRGQFAAFVRDSGHSGGNECFTFEGGKSEKRSGRNWQNPSYGQTDSHPAVCVSWDDAKAYVAWLARKTGKGYRLLSEAEWEHGARAGTSTARYWSESPDQACGYANVLDGTGKSQVPDVTWEAHNCTDGHAYTAPGGSFKPNAFGLYDMIGNAWEWTEDCSNDNYNGAPGDGSVWTSGDCEKRVIRGSSWYERPQFARSASRGRNVTAGRGNGLGFRLARTLP